MKRHNRCIGFSIFTLGRIKIELWFVPSNENIEPHIHNNINSRLLFLFCHNQTFCKMVENKYSVVSYFLKMKFWSLKRYFFIKAGQPHYFKSSNWPLIFLNIETWKKGIKPTSASVDFQLT